MALKHGDKQCAGCSEMFASTKAFDRHLRVRRMRVTTPKGNVIESEEVVTCRPLGEFEARGLQPDDRGRWSMTTDAERERLARIPSARPGKPNQPGSRVETE